MRRTSMRGLLPRALVVACFAQFGLVAGAAVAFPAAPSAIQAGLLQPTLSAYVQAHTELHSDDNRRLRQMLEWSHMFNTTSPNGHLGLVTWYQQHNDQIFAQPANHVKELGSSRVWGTPDAEWQQIHDQQAQEMKRHQELDLILYGDSIFESILGTTVGHKIARARGIPKVWSRNHGTSRRRIVSIAGDTTVDMIYRLLNGGMPIDLKVNKVVVQIGANNILQQWQQIPGDYMRRTAAIAESIVAVCDLILAAWPDTDLLLTAILVGGNRGDMPGDFRDWSLPNRYSESAGTINEILQKWVYSRTDRRVSYLDCSHLYIIEHDPVTGGRVIDADLMPDTLHPNRFGFKLLLEQCLEPALYEARKETADISNSL